MALGFTAAVLLLTAAPLTVVQVDVWHNAEGSTEVPADLLHRDDGEPLALFVETAAGLVLVAPTRVAPGQVVFDSIPEGPRLLRTGWQTWWVDPPPLVDLSKHRAGVPGAAERFSSIELEVKGLHPWADGDDVQLLGSLSGRMQFGFITQLPRGETSTRKLVAGRDGGVADDDELRLVQFTREQRRTGATSIDLHHAARSATVFEQFVPTRQAQFSEQRLTRLSVGFDCQQWAAVFSKPATASNVQLSVGVLPYTSDFGQYAGTPDLLRIKGTVDRRHCDVGWRGLVDDSFPFAWQRYVKVRYAAGGDYPFFGETRLLKALDSLEVTGPTPAIGAATELRFDGRLLSWHQPTFGTVKSYLVEVVASPTKEPWVLATLTTSATSLRFPLGFFERLAPLQIVFRVTASTDDLFKAARTLPSASTTVASPIFRVAEDPVRELTLQLDQGHSEVTISLTNLFTSERTVATTTETSPSFSLPPGPYLLAITGFQYESISRPLTIGRSPIDLRVPLTVSTPLVVELVRFGGKELRLYANGLLKLRGSCSSVHQRWASKAQVERVLALLRRASFREPASIEVNLVRDVRGQVVSGSVDEVEAVANAIEEALDTTPWQRCEGR